MTEFLKYCLLFLLAAVLPAQTYTTLTSFSYAHGSDPIGGLVQGFDGNLYGTANQGGSAGGGTAYQVTLSGTLTVVYNFSRSGPNDPLATLVQGADGKLYGTTYQGVGTGCGGFGCGTVFSVTPGGVFTALHNFSYAEGARPLSLVQAVNGNLYGVTRQGGMSSSCPVGCGTIFKITPSGSLTIVHNFAQADGDSPIGALVQAFNGDLLGVTNYGGAGSHFGTIFQLGAGGALQTLYSLSSAQQSYPAAGFVQASDGNFYGTTGGCSAGTCGTVFKITPDGALTTLYVFPSSNGASPNSALVEATDGNLYGTTLNGGGSGFGCSIPAGCGTIFKITPAGDLTTLYSFNTAVYPGQMIQATDGNLYGVTSGGGADNLGSIFRLSISLGPFVKTVPVAGNVGATVHILGTNLTTPVSVTFNGVPAVVLAASPSQIIAAVPAGATTGRIAVTTPTGTLLSNTVFQVRP